MLKLAREQRKQSKSPSGREAWHYILVQIEKRRKGEGKDKDNEGVIAGDVKKALKKFKYDVMELEAAEELVRKQQEEAEAS